MAYIIDNIPYMRGFVRKEFLHNETKGHGEFVEAVAYAVRCVRGSSIWLQCALGEPYGGAHFMVPIIAFCWKRCDRPDDLRYVQPWDCFGPDFGVCELNFVKRGAAYILPDRRPAQYRFTLDFVHTDLADDMLQHKHLHFAYLDGGLVGCFPNNRILMPDTAFWPMAADDIKWDFLSYEGDCRAEGNEHIFARDKTTTSEQRWAENALAIRESRMGASA